MRTKILYSALLSALLSTIGLLAIPGQSFAERYSSSQRDNPSHLQRRADRPRAKQPRADRPRANHSQSRVVRSRADHRRYDHRNGDNRRWSKRSHHPRRYTPRYRYYRKPWYKYPHRHYYPSYGRYYYDDDFWGWLAFTVITLAIIDNLNEEQQREHELVMYEALKAPMGETIQWRDGNASGSVTVIREGTSSIGRYCREYTQEIVIGGESQRAYGTACRNPDGSWEIKD